MNRSFSGNILHASERGRLPLAADIKPVSPRDGELVSGRDPVSLALILERAGVCALSVVTEAVHFGGSMELLQQVAGAVSLPVLMKDFITSARQIDEAFEAGASAVLLTIATIPELELPGLYLRAVSLGIEPLVEVHTAAELGLALGLKPKLAVIGINNRDITALEKDDGDVRVTEMLAPLVPKGIAILSESSILTPGDVNRALAAGAHAVLVGTALLQAEDPGARARELAGRTSGE